MKCVYCHKDINKKDDYFKVELYSEGKKKGTDFCHKRCHLENQQPKNELNRLVYGLSDFAARQGFIPEREIKI